MSHLEDIISDIKNESCVLIVGPDLVDFGNKSCFEVLCEELKEDARYNQFVDLDPQYIFPHEELLQPRTQKETPLLRFMEEFYEKQIQFNEPLKKISQIPFHLIVSFFPDTRLKNMFEEQGMDFEYSHYSREDPPQQVDKPSKEKPLIYNLLGDFKTQDIIITFDHLFKYLSKIMGEWKLPNNLQERFKRARTFIFLGVRFERWYVQLLLRILTAEQHGDRLSTLENVNKNEITTFIARRLSVEFIETNPQDFLNQLHDECDSQDLLKVQAKKPKAKVFISYGHQDKETALAIEKYLRAAEIECIIDYRSMSGGQKIEKFIETIQNIDCVLVIISRKSMESSWVSKEIVTTLQHTNKYFLPCYLDETFLQKKEFITEMEMMVNEKLNLLAEQFKERVRGDTDDLVNDKKDLTDYINNLPFILNELKRRKCVSVKPGELENTIPSIVEDILKAK